MVEMGGGELSSEKQADEAPLSRRSAQIPVKAAPCPATKGVHVNADQKTKESWM